MNIEVLRQYPAYARLARELAEANKTSGERHHLAMSVYTSVEFPHWDIYTQPNPTIKLNGEYTLSELLAIVDFMRQ